MPSARDEILLLASRQGGWISGSQIHDSRATLWRLVQSGALVGDQGLYRLAAGKASSESRIWRAVVATGGVLSHISAARRLSGTPALGCPVDVLVAYGHTPAREGVVVHRTRRLPESHVVRDEAGFRITIAPRTLVDICAPARGLTDSQIVDIVDAWLASGRAKLSWLQWFVETEAHHLPGRRRAAHILGLDQRVDSAAERRLSRLLRAAGLLACVNQYVLRDPDGAFLARVDFAWPERHVALELDSYRYHSGPGVFVQDRRRGNEIGLSGWTLLRTTVREIEDAPDVLIENLRRALAVPARA
jgi:very-short-patch-repair endonuclease